MCFQEMELSKSFAEISQELSKYGFEAVVQERKGFPVVNVIFFRPSRLPLLWAQHRSRALIVAFALPDGRELCVANVHLEAKNNEYSRRQRAAQLASVLKRVSGSRIICGDFNDPLVYDSALSVQLTKAGLARAPTKGITLAHPGYADTLDHIWASEDFVPRLVLGSSPQTLAALEATGIPNETYPSDHLPVAATFGFGKSAKSRQNTKQMLMLEIPASPCVDIREEWVQICRHAKFNGSKRELREQKQTEAAFLELLCEDDAAKLREWRESASRAAKFIVAAAVASGRVTERAKVGAAVEKPFDPGVPLLNVTTLHGA
jgi:hypothetical protein